LIDIPSLDKKMQALVSSQDRNDTHNGYQDETQENEYLRQLTSRPDTDIKHQIHAHV
jgi:hypothetical protein